MKLMLTVIETSAFQRQAAAIWSDTEREAFIDFIAVNPEKGVVIKKTVPAARKVRWTREGIGKSGGARVIYYYLDEDGAVLLVTVYAKGRRDTMSASEINNLNKGD
jgi:mRNA-degrading endonuclease RelE of RelBE toxin-antitoxin system